MLYKTCERCGANLDPGERCECEREAAQAAELKKRAAEPKKIKIIKGGERYGTYRQNF